MKKLLFTISVGALSLMAVSLPMAAYAQSATGTAEVNTRAAISAKDVLQHTRENILKTNAELKERAAAFKQNIIDLKNAPLMEKKAFLVSSYNSADAFFNQRYDDFVLVLNLASSRGADVSEARAHFAKAKEVLIATKVHLQALSALNDSDLATPTAKEVAKKIEANYKQVREEMHAGAVALKAAIQVKASTTTTPPVVTPLPTATQ